MRSGILKHTLPAAINAVPCTLNQDMRAVDVRPKLNPKFLLRFVQGFNDELLASLVKQGATVESIDSDLLRLMEVPVPPKAEQDALVALLDRETARIDALIEKKTRFIELLREKREALITQAVTQGLDPAVPMKDSGVEWLGRVPAHWRVVALKWLTRIGNGSTPSREDLSFWTNSEFPWLTSSVVNKENVKEAEEFVTEEALRKCHLPVVNPPAVLIGLTGQGRTRGLASTLQFQATISQHLAFVKPLGDDLNVAYLRRYLDMAYARLRMESEGAGSTKPNFDRPPTASARCH